jgi:hypothetical protein
MKKPKLLITILTFIFLYCHSANLLGQDQTSKLTHPFSYPLIQLDKNSYTLTVGQPIKIKQDTVLYKMTPNNYKIKQEKQSYITVPVTFTNNTDDTLEYVGMSCSWWDIYTTNNAEINILQPKDNCYKNGPTVTKLAPKISSVVYLSIAYPVHVNTSSVRIGMIFKKHTNGKNDIYIPAVQKSNVIWANEVFLPI